MLRSFVFAGRGIAQTIRDERNFRIHLTAIVWVSLFSAVYRLSIGRFAVILLFFALVPCAELLNTALENAVDAIGIPPCKAAQRAKDAAAGAVLWCAVSALVAAILIFRSADGWRRVFGVLRTPFGIAGIAVLSVLSVLFVFLPKGRKSVGSEADTPSVGAETDGDGEEKK